MPRVPTACPVHTQTALRTAATHETGTHNPCGDSQIAADVVADDICFAALRACGRVAVAASEERTAEADLGGSDYSVAFDPLDGSSVAGAGWAVGAIFGVWPGRGLVGRTGDEQVAAVYAVFGPRVTLVVAARPTPGAAPVAREFVLSAGGLWARRGATLSLPRLAPGATPSHFAPANLKATRDNRAYAALVDKLTDAGATLRYTGAMVADCHHVLAKGAGAFYNPASSSAPPKLRLLFEVAPVAFVFEAAGGAALGANGARLLSLTVNAAEQRVAAVFGQVGAVDLALDALKEG